MYNINYVILCLDISIKLKVHVIQLLPIYTT